MTNNYCTEIQALGFFYYLLWRSASISCCKQYSEVANMFCQNKSMLLSWSFSLNTKLFAIFNKLFACQIRGLPPSLMLLMHEGHQIFSATFDARFKIYFTITFHHASLNRKMGFNSSSKQTNTVRFRRTYLVLYTVWLDGKIGISMKLS